MVLLVDNLLTAEGIGLIFKLSPRLGGDIVAILRHK